MRLKESLDLFFLKKVDTIAAQMRSRGREIAPPRNLGFQASSNGGEVHIALVEFEGERGC
jgi:hypothetical protein